MYFYELHEGDEDIFTDLLLIHDELMDPEDFFELVQVVREQIKATFEEDTLIEAIALELEREHGFTYVSDDKLAASVRVSMVEDENQLIGIDDSLDTSGAERAAYRSILADFEGEMN